MQSRGQNRPQRPAGPRTFRLSPIQDKGSAAFTIVQLTNTLLNCRNLRTSQPSRDGTRGEQLLPEQGPRDLLVLVFSSS